MSEINEVVVPDLGLFSHYPPEGIPRRLDDNEFLHIGLSYCRNISMSRKANCIKKSQGIQKFSASATGATDSVRGIGVLNKHAIPNDYEKETAEKVVASTDDCYVTEEDSAIDLTGTGITLGYYASTAKNYHGGFRFQTINIAQGAQIISAHLKIKCGSAQFGAVELKIYGEDADDSATFSTYADFAGRSLTTACIDWDISPVYEGQWYTSPDIKSIIQEIVDRAGWAANNALSLIVKNDYTSSPSKRAVFYAYDHSSGIYAAQLLISVTVGLDSSPTYFMYVKGTSVGELWKLDENKTPSEVTQGGESYAGSYQSQIAKFLQYGDDLLVTDDGKNDACQQWDISDNPSAFEDVTANQNGRYIIEFKSRLWYLFCLVAGTVYKNRAYYTNVNDQTVVDSFIPLPGSDAPTAVILLTQDDMIVFKKGSCYRVVDRETTASDFKPYLISPEDGSLGANVILAGSLVYGRNEKGVFQWPVSGYPNGFRYISEPIQDEIDKVPLDKMNLVWFAHDRTHGCVLMHYPDTGYSRNTLCAVFNYKKDCWENISDVWAGNVMVDAFDTDGTPIMLLGQEDGYLKKIGGEDNEGADFPALFDTGALFKLDKEKNFISRELLSLLPVTNYDGSMTLNFYYKAYDRPGGRASASWNGPYTHQVLRGNEEYIPIKPGGERKFHIIRVEGTLKDEAFEVQGLKLKWGHGSLS